MFSPYHYANYGVKVSMGILNKIWWHLMPGVTVKVKWPKGWVVLHDSPEGSQVSVDSADPNDHYRPWMEKNVGRQGWDWDWCMRDNDITENRLTVKVRQRYANYATIIAMRWS